MTRSITATLLAAAIALTSITVTAAPARADDNLDKFILGIGALAILGAIVHESNKDVSGHVTVGRTYPYPRPYVRPHRVHPYVVQPRVVRPRVVHPRVVHPRVVHPRVVDPVRPRLHDDRTLPAKCVRSVNTRNGPYRYFERRCLSEHAPRIALPSNCIRTVDGRNADYRVYGARCLRNRGYRF